MHRFGIVTVCLNDLAGLVKTCESIRRQTFNDYRWLVVDGASTDGTVDWLARCDVPDFRYISEKDAGLYHAMNRGIEVLRNEVEYIIFLNSGDYFHGADVLGQTSRALDSLVEKPMLLYGDSIERFVDGDSFYRKARKPSWITMGMFTHHQAAFFRMSDQLYYDTDLRLAADYELFFRYIRMHGELACHYLGFPVCDFSLGGLSHTKRRKSILEEFGLRRKHNVSLPVNGILVCMHFIVHFVKVVAPGSIRLFGLRKRIDKDAQV